MITKREILSIAGITIILAFAFSIKKFSPSVLAYSALAIFLLISINLLAKKVTSYYLDSQIEAKFWHTQRFGYRAHWHLEKPFPAGIFFPIITAALSLGYFIWMACFTFDVKAKSYRAAKRHGIYSFSEMTESDIGLIAASGIVANLFFAMISYFAGWELFTELSIYYAFFNMMPFSDLDGNKIFYGELLLWNFLALITLLALAYAFLVV